jgi:hypothetical protein
MSRYGACEALYGGAAVVDWWTYQYTSEVAASAMLSFQDEVLGPGMVWLGTLRSWYPDMQGICGAIADVVHKNSHHEGQNPQSVIVYAFPRLGPSDRR